MSAPDYSAVPPCSYCGKTYQQACDEAEAAGRESTGWMTTHGPGEFRDSACAAQECRQASDLAYQSARLAEDFARVGAAPLSEQPRQ